jgi:peptidoglycan/xylan/chitin deacetylase (PgdA/CDA1 family)
VAAGAVLAWGLPSVSILLEPVRRALDVRASVVARDGVGLTFDDGPHPQGTPAVLSALADYGAQATFFLVGEQVVRHPELVHEIRDAGHEIALHCDRHRNSMRLTPRQLRDDLDRAHERIAAAAGESPRRYRPPYGVLPTTAWREARRRGWETVLWRSNGRDWRARATPASIAGRLLDGVAGGEVLLLHDADYYSAPGSWRRTADGLRIVLESLAARRLAVHSLAGAGGTLP